MFDEEVIQVSVGLLAFAGVIAAIIITIEMIEEIVKVRRAQRKQKRK